MKIRLTISGGLHDGQTGIVNLPRESVQGADVGTVIELAAPQATFWFPVMFKIDKPPELIVDGTSASFKKT